MTVDIDVTTVSQLVMELSLLLSYTPDIEPGRVIGSIQEKVESLRSAILVLELTLPGEAREQLSSIHGLIDGMSAAVEANKNLGQLNSTVPFMTRNPEQAALAAHLGQAAQLQVMIAPYVRALEASYTIQGERAILLPASASMAQAELSSRPEDEDEEDEISVDVTAVHRASFGLPPEDDDEDDLDW